MRKDMEKCEDLKLMKSLGNTFNKIIKNSGPECLEYCQFLIKKLLYEIIDSADISRLKSHYFNTVSKIIENTNENIINFTYFTTQNVFEKLCSLIENYNLNVGINFSGFIEIIRILLEKYYEKVNPKPEILLKLTEILILMIFPFGREIPLESQENLRKILDDKHILTNSFNLLSVLCKHNIKFLHLVTHYFCPILIQYFLYCR